MQKTETFFFIHRRCEEKILRSKTTTKKFYRISLRYKSFYNVVQRLWMDDPVTYVSFSLEICSTFFHEYYVSLSFIIKQALLSYQPLVEYPVIYVKYARYEKYFHLHENPILPVRFDNWSAIKFDRVTSKENDNKFLTRRYLGDQRPRGVKVRHLAVSTRFANSLEDRYVPMKPKLRVIRDLRPWGKLHLAQFSTTWKLDWELTIDELTPRVSLFCILLDFKHRPNLSISRNHKKRILSTEFPLLFQIHRIENEVNLISRSSKKITGSENRSFSQPILDDVNFRFQRTEISLFRITIQIFPETEKPSRSISSLRTGTLQPGCSLLMSLWTFYRGNFRKAFHRGSPASKEMEKTGNFLPGPLYLFPPPPEKRVNATGMKGVEKVEGSLSPLLEAYFIR